MLYLHLHITYASTRINKQLHTLCMNLHVLHAYAVKFITYATHVYYLYDMRTCITFAHTRIIHLVYIHLDTLHDTSRYSYQYTITCST